MKSKFVLETIFDEIWESWPNKEKEHAARKAYDVFCKSEGDVDQLKKACRIYVLDSTGDEFHYQLNNFILQDHWKDIIESGTSLERLEKERQACIDLINTWNDACLSHWIKSEDIEDKIVSARRALQNQYFQKNWKKALDKAKKIFQYRFRESDPRARIILSFRWFSRCQPEKHTVLKIIEGEYGYPSKTEKRYEQRYKEISPEERQEAILNFYEVFSDFKKPKKKREFKSFPNKQLENLVNDVLDESSLQENTAPPEEVPQSHDEYGGEDDPFRLF
jgi:hypothetical protein